MVVTVDLTQCRPGYDGYYRKMEIMYDVDGIWLQEVEGCGYRVIDLTPDEASRIGEALIAASKAVQIPV